MVDTTTTTATTTAATTTAAAVTTAPWYEGKADAETVGYFQNRGWADKDAATVAIEASKAHREAEKFIGAPANQLLRLPTDPKDEAGWKAVWGRLGAPADAAGYDFSTVKDAAGKPLDTSVTDAIRARAAELHLPKDVASEVAQTFAKISDDRAAAAAADTAAALAQEQTKLKANWGQNHDANMQVARNAAAALKVSPEAIAALEKTVGYAQVMEMFRAVGSKIGEDKFIGGGEGARPGIMSANQAADRKAELMRDTGWTKRYLEGGVAENREMQNLIGIMVSAAE